MFCRNCGKEISDDSKFCCFCGNDLKDTTEVVEAEAVPVTPKASEVAEEKETPALVIAGFILAFIEPLLGLVLSLVGLNELKKTNNKNTGLCKAGIIISAVFIVLPILLGLVFFVIIIIIAILSPSVIDEIVSNIDSYAIMIRCLL